MDIKNINIYSFRSDSIDNLKVELNLFDYDTYRFNYEFLYQTIGNSTYTCLLIARRKM